MLCGTLAEREIAIFRVDYNKCRVVPDYVGWLVQLTGGLGTDAFQISMPPLVIPWPLPVRSHFCLPLYIPTRRCPGQQKLLSLVVNNICLPDKSIMGNVNSLCVRPVEECKW
jgi:hypothetical protein